MRNSFSDPTACSILRSGVLSAFAIACVCTVTLSLSKGRWRESLTQNTTRECWNEKACSGGVANNSSKTDGYCAAGYKGPCK
jgi:hypothetical protein